MRFKIDENLPKEAAELFRKAGHDAMTVHEQELVGRSDAKIAGVCRRERRCIVTLDLDFADIRAYPPADYEGILVLRLSRMDKRLVLQILQDLMPNLEGQDITGALWIVDEKRIRIRRSQSR